MTWDFGGVSRPCGERSRCILAAGSRVGSGTAIPGRGNNDMKTRGNQMSSRARAEAGMSLVELMIAMLVLAVGMAGVLLMITSGIASNNRNKMDTTATNLSQMVLEEIISKPAGSNPVLTIQDCRPAALGGPQNLQITTIGAPAPAGAGAQILSPAAGGNGDIDWNNQAAAAVP